MSELLAWSAAMVSLVWIVQAVANMQRHPQGSATKRTSSPLELMSGFVYPILVGSSTATLLLGAGRFQWGWPDALLQLIGLLASIAGLVVYIRAKVELGESYSADARVWMEQQLITSGLYGLVRHPIYFGSILVWLGIGLGIASWTTLGLTSAILVPAIIYRSRLEERLLRERFGRQYTAYRSRVPMLFPWPRPEKTTQEDDLAELVEMADQPIVPEQE
ncbi:MAG TPA: isoprenylcysteine carboxylmethyltransferase family protein [Chloroflexota bacterium]|nr:isoprenylcysteine carboxylmethyltransferase family protein [Chloroflexota bacterium]